jgi:hypothetical protein
VSRLRVGLAALLVFGALAAIQLSLPGSTMACSCVAPDPNAPVFSGEEQAVFVGTAGQPQADGTYRFAVERWFVGGNAAQVNVTSERIPGPDGAMGIDTCGLHFEVGDRLIMSASVDAGVYQPALCSPHAVVDSEEGQRLLNAAVAAFGQGAAPGPPVDTPLPDGPDLAGLALGAVGILVLVVLITVVASARRRREDEPAA